MDAQERARLRALCEAVKERRAELAAVDPFDGPGLVYALTGYSQAAREHERAAITALPGLLDALDASEASVSELKARSTLTVEVRLYAAPGLEEGVLEPVYESVRSTAEGAYQLGVEEGLRRAAALVKEAEWRR